MKKIVCVVLAVLFVFAFVGCSNGGTFSEKNYLSENGQIRSIIIDVADRELNIGLSSDGQISVNYFDSEKQYLEISVRKATSLSYAWLTTGAGRIFSESNRTKNIAE